MKTLKKLVLLSIVLFAFIQCDVTDTNTKTHYDIVIRNNSATEVEVNLYSDKFEKPKTQSVKAKDSYTFELDEPDTVAIYAKTYVKVEHEIVGEIVQWSGEIAVTKDDKKNTTDLDVSENIFFVKLTNTGIELGPIFVQHGSSQEQENILIPNDGKQYNVGYFKFDASSTTTKFGAYKYPSTSNYVYWDLTNDGTTNQVKELSNSLTKPVLSSTANNEIEAQESIPTAAVSSSAVDLKFEPSAVHLISKTK